MPEPYCERLAALHSQGSVVALGRSVWAKADIGRPAYYEKDA